MIIGMTFSIITGLILNIKSKINPVLTALVIIPWAMPPIVNGIMWKFIFFPGYGFMNKILLNLHLINSPVSWTDNRYLFLIVISIVISWRIIPFSSLVILANLQNIPESYYDTVEVFGGSRFQAFYYVTLPLLLPSIGVVLINLTTTALSIFDEVIAISGYQFEIQTLLLEIQEKIRDGIRKFSSDFKKLHFSQPIEINYMVPMILPWSSIADKYKPLQSKVNITHMRINYIGKAVDAINKERVVVNWASQDGEDAVYLVEKQA